MNLSEQTGQQKNNDEETPLDAIDYARTQAHLAERLDPARTPAVPVDLIPGYEILEEIHRGGQGVVYKARRHSTDQLVAIKVLRWGQLARSADQLRFDRELRVLAKLQHPNIVAVHDGGARDDVRYFVMDYVRGRTLQQYAQENPPLEARLRVFLRICRAVDAAHRRGVIHRDLKPSNVIVDDDGEPRVVDFGLAKLTEANDLGLTLHQTVEGANFLGSLPWLAPEQAEGHSTTADARTDVYGLGTLLYVLLTQRPPFEIDGPPRRVLNAICHEQPQPPSALVAALDPDLDIITLQCLSKEPHRRYPTVSDLQHDVEQFLAGEPIGARRDSTLYVLRMALRRYRRLTILSVTCVLVITGFAIAMSVLAGRIRDERDASRRVNRELMVETARSEIRFGDAVRAADLLWSVHLDQPPGDGVGGSLESRWALWELYDRQPCLATWQAHAGRVGGLYFSPDGMRLASVGRLDARLKYWDPRNGKLLKDTALSGCSGQSFVSFSPDGARIAMGCDDGSIRLWNIEGGRQEALLEGHVNSVKAVAFTRNGDLLISGSTDGSLRVWDVVTQQCIGVLEGHAVSIASLALDATGDLLASFDQSGLLNLWDLSQRELRSTLKPPPRGVDASTGYSVDVHGTTVAFGIDYGVYTWDAATAEKRKLYDHSDAVMGVSFSPSGKWLVSASRDRSIIVWDRERGAISQIFRGNDSLPRCIVFSPHEEMIAAGLENGAIKLWQIQLHPALTRLDHVGTVHCARYSPPPPTAASWYPADTKNNLGFGFGIRPPTSYFRNSRVTRR